MLIRDFVRDAQGRVEECGDAVTGSGKIVSSDSRHAKIEGTYRGASCHATPHGQHLGVEVLDDACQWSGTFTIEIEKSQD